MVRPFVAYYRVGGGHDFEEQVRCVEDHAREVGGEVIKSYRDDETSKRPERPELRKALAYAKRKDAALIVATIQGLSRDVPFLKSVLDSGVDFVACDLPDGLRRLRRVGHDRRVPVKRRLSPDPPTIQEHPR